MIDELKFWRTKSGNEVDFVVEGQKLIPVEVKYQDMKSPVIPSGIRSFVELYDSENAFVITKNFLHKIRRGKTHLYFIPAFIL